MNKEKEENKTKEKNQPPDNGIIGEIEIDHVIGGPKAPLDLPDELSYQESLELLQKQLDKAEEMKDKTVEDPEYVKWREETLYIVLKTCTEESLYYSMLYNSFELDLQNPKAFELVPQTFTILLEERTSILKDIITKFEEAIAEEQNTEN